MSEVLRMINAGRKHDIGYKQNLSGSESLLSKSWRIGATTTEDSSSDTN